jgi:hypothetical protein
MQIISRAACYFRNFTTGGQFLFFFLDPGFYSIPNTIIGTILQGLFQSLNLSPDNRHLSP